nr:DUF4915 domain-containing protein [Xenococcaceae cyanobacterium MO_207.B15]
RTGLNDMQRGMSEAEIEKSYQSRFNLQWAWADSIATVSLLNIRQLNIKNEYAVVGISKPRQNKTFSNLPLDDNLAAYKTEPYSGLLVIDLKTGKIVHSLLIQGRVSELYDVAILPGVKRLMNLGFKSKEIHHMINIGSMP